MNIVDKTDENCGARRSAVARAAPVFQRGALRRVRQALLESFALAMNQMVANHQFAHSELARNLSDQFDGLGSSAAANTSRRLYRQRSNKAGRVARPARPRLRNGQVRIFGASIF